MKVVAKKKWRGDRKTLKKLYSAICRTKIDYGCQLYNTASAGRTKKLDSIHREGIRIYTGAFRTSPAEALHVEANDPPLELRRNELGLRFLYKLKSNPSYIDTLNTIDDSEDQNYEESERSIKPTGVYLRGLEQRYMEEQKEIEVLNQTQQPSWMVNNISFCYEGEKCFGNDNERKQHFLQHKEKHKSNKEAFTDGSKSIGRKVGFAAVFTDTTRRGALL